ncbi:MAG TPA: O-antigen ligase family protein [Rhizomicrobium sp.]|nr:O-antigen ligase family protein [Rhizomicrobium sp.]
MSLPVPPAFFRRRSVWWLFVPILVFSSLIYGYLFATNAPNIILPFFIPPVVLAGLVIWALPETGQGPIRLLNACFVAYFVTLIIWPNYLAVALPGLPWITVTRLTGFPLTIALLICVSVSSEFRAKLKDVLGTSPWLWKFLLAFVAIQFLSLAFSNNFTASAQKFVAAQFNWTAIFFASCYYFLKPGRAIFWSHLLWFMALFVTVIAMWESSIGHPPWAGHIPSFLAIQDESVLRGLKGGMRSYTTKYRAQGTFGVSLGLSEYIALAFPFVIHIATSDDRMKVRIAAAASLPILLYTITLSGARLGLVGCLISSLGYGLAWGIDRWRRQPNSLIGPALVLSYPMFFAASIGAVFFVGRIRNLVVGDGSQQASNDARLTQLTMAIPKIISHPWGYGISMSAVTLGFREPDGLLTIDSYYLSLLLEYGIIGLVIFYGMFALSIYQAGKCWLNYNSTEKELTLFVPLILSLLAFCVMKAVFSQEDSHALVFMMMGMIAALAFRQNKFRLGSPKPHLRVLRSEIINRTAA